MKAWPFLFTRGRVLDHQLVVCPSIFRPGARWGEFSRIVARLEAQPQDGLRTREIVSQQLGDLTLIYREDFARRNGEIAEDVAGRSVKAIRGVMVEGRSAAQVSSLANDAMARAAPLLDSAFEAFWDRTEDGDPSFVDGFEMGTRRNQSTAAMQAAPATNVPNSPMMRTALTMLVPLLLLAGLFLWQSSATTRRLADLETKTLAALNELQAKVKEQADAMDRLRKEQDALKAPPVPAPAPAQ